MNYTQDATFLTMLFVLPSLFGLTLIGDGVSKVMSYDNRGWVTVSIGSVFVLIILIGYLMIRT